MTTPPTRISSSTDPGRRTLIAGDRGVLIEVPDLDAALGLHRRLRDLQAGPEAVAGILELVPAARTVLVRFDPALVSRAQLVAATAAVSAAPADSVATDETVGALQIPVVYDGEDLTEVAAILGISAEEVVRRHTGTEYTVAFAGFAPGFGYLVGGHPSLDVPRRTVPRRQIPAGSVGLAGRFSGVYPRPSPGGWQLIGSTTLPMFDVDRDPPATLEPGDRVRFVAIPAPAGITTVPSVTTVPSGSGLPQRAPSSAASSAGPALIIERPGVRSLLQDAGREGRAAWGVSGSGALDLPALHAANGLVGNPEGTAALEILLGRFRARARGQVVVGASGAPIPITVTPAGGADPIVITDRRRILLDDGDVLTLGAPTSGLRTMLAVRGGFDVPAVLGSLSTDTLAGLGPPPIARGDVLAVGDPDDATEAAPEAVAWQALPREEVTIPVDLGPRDDWFDDASLDRLCSRPWTVSTDADRVGIRLTGAQPLLRVSDDELPSEGVVTGSIQVPPNGQPIVFLADHPLTGGYPVIGVVRSTALPALAQVTPGMTVRFIVPEVSTR